MIAVLCKWIVAYVGEYLNYIYNIYIYIYIIISKALNIPCSGRGETKDIVSLDIMHHIDNPV